MKNFLRRGMKRLMPLSAASVLMAGGVGASAVIAGGTADAATCTGPVPAGTPCTITGTLVVTSGTLTMIAPPALGWSETINGLNQSLVDPAPADETFTVDDATGSAAGWHITVAATQLTSAAAGTFPLANTGTLSVNGSLAAATDTTAPSAVCAVTSTCTPPTNLTTYPVPVTTGTAVTPVTIFDAAAGSGVGTTVIGSPGANPVGWWLAVPSNVIAGTYTSTVTLELVGGP